MFNAITICILVAYIFGVASAEFISPFPVNYKYGSTKIESYPHHASLRLASESKHFCSGAIISERWLLTAAQCTQGKETANLFIVVGITNLTQEGDRYEIATIVNHPEYEITEKKRVNDIAMIKTTENIKMRMSGVLPISLPSDKMHYLLENHMGLFPAIVTGWREYIKTSDPTTGAKIMPDLHMQKSNIRNRKSCCRHLGHVNGKMLTADHLCTVFEGHNVCVGDTGSPFVSDEKEILGIASWHSLTKCGYGFPKVYTYVYSYLPWIQNNINTI